MSDLSGSAQGLRTGYSTGSCATAASQAALVKLLGDNEVNEVRVELPDGAWITIPIRQVFVFAGKASAEVIKDAGDDPDVTHGTSILATVELLAQEKIIIEGGRGVGRVTKPGLAIEVGEAAINPVPRAMIRSAVQKLLPPGTGAKIIISAPQGEELARRTMNPRLGIEGGISILGTSGIVRPMSEAAYLASLVPQLDQAIALGHRNLLLTPGKMGERQAKALGIAADSIIQTSNYVGIMIKEAVLRNVKTILLIGHIGKIIKVAAGIFNTHSKIADARRETLAAHAAMLGAAPEIIREIMELNTMEASVSLLKSHQLEAAYDSIAASASQRIRDYIAVNCEHDTIKVGTMLYALDGEILGYDQAGMQLCKQMSGQDELDQVVKHRIEEKPDSILKPVFAQPNVLRNSAHEDGTRNVGSQSFDTATMAGWQKDRLCDTRADNWQENRFCGQVVKVVGTGPGDPGYISPLALEIISQAEILIGARRLLDCFAQPDQIQVLVDKDLTALVAYIEQERQKRQIVVLVSGDTGLFSLADYLIKHMDHEVVEFIPGISSVQLMFARLKRPWQEAQILSMHGRSHDNLAEQIELAPLTALLTGTPWTPQVIAQYLLEQGVADRKIALGKDLSYPQEKLIYSSLMELCRDEYNYKNTVMVIFNEKMELY